MRYQLTVLGAGSLVGKNLCRRAVRLGWDVNAFSVEDIRPSKKNYRRRIFYNDDLNWRENLTWNASYNYDGRLEQLHDEIKNCTGVVLLHEETPLISSGKVTFEENAIKLAKLCGQWSVKHLICVEDVGKNAVISPEAEDMIGDTNDLLIVSLIRANQIYSYDSLSTCLKIYRNRTLKSVGIDAPPVDAINSETIAKAITSLIHDSSDTNVYRILDRGGIETYLRDKNIPFDSPEEEQMRFDDDTGNDDQNEDDISIRYGFNDDEYEYSKQLESGDANDDGNDLDEADEADEADDLEDVDDVDNNRLKDETKNRLTDENKGNVKVLMSNVNIANEIDCHVDYLFKNDIAPQ